MTKEPDDIDELMARLNDADYITNIPRKDLDRHIAYQRKQRAAREAGVKTRKPKAAEPAVSLTSLLSTVVVPAPTKGGFRRRF